MGPTVSHVCVSATKQHDLNRYSNPTYRPISVFSRDKQCVFGVCVVVCEPQTRTHNQKACGKAVTSAHATCSADNLSLSHLKYQLRGM